MTMKLPLLLCLTVALTALETGCSSTPQSRIKKNPEVFNSYSAEVRSFIEKGRVAVDFTPEQVRLALGAPDRVLTRMSAAGNEEVWIYRENKARFGVELGLGFGGGPVSTGVGVSTAGREFPDERLRVVFAAGRVTEVVQIMP
jgi:hypothetical protein